MTVREIKYLQYLETFYLSLSPFYIKEAYCPVSNIPAKGSRRNSPAVASLLNSDAYMYADAEICHSGDICNLIFLQPLLCQGSVQPLRILKSLCVQIRWQTLHFCFSDRLKLCAVHLFTRQCKKCLIGLHKNFYP